MSPEPVRSHRPTSKKKIRLTVHEHAGRTRQEPPNIRKKTAAPEIIAIGRLSRLRGKDEGEMAVLVDDRHQHQELGTLLYRRLIEVARDEHFTRISSTILAENREIEAICRKLGLQMENGSGRRHGRRRP